MAARVFGVPWDATTIGRKGSRRGPTAIRNELARRLYPYDMEAERSAAWVDGGDLKIGDDHSEMVAAIDAAHKRVSSRSQRTPFVLIGGDHAVTYGGVAAVRKDYPDLHVVNLDAHLDLRSNTHGPTNGNWALRVVQEFGHPFWEIGTGRFSNGETLFEMARSLGVRVVSAADIRRLGVIPALEEAELGALRGKDVYLSLDIDVIDQAHAPGVSAPTVEGLSPTTTLGIVELITRTGRVRGFDIVEVNPLVDRAGTTSRVAAYLLLAFLSAVESPHER